MVGVAFSRGVSQHAREQRRRRARRQGHGGAPGLASDCGHNIPLVQHCSPRYTHLQRSVRQLRSCAACRNVLCHARAVFI